MKAEEVTSNELPHHHQNYILTRTLDIQLAGFNALGLQVPNESFVKEIEDGIVVALQNVFTGMDVVIEDKSFGPICEKIIEEANKVSERNLVVSTSPMIAYQLDGIALGISRIVDLNGNIIGVGARPGFNSVRKQLENISQKLQERGIVLAEDGAFTGSTISFLLKETSHLGIKIEKIILGVLFPRAESVFKEIFSGDMVVFERATEAVDWMPSHDFMPFIPNCGRTVGHKFGVNYLPTYLHDGTSLSMPYIFPYGDPISWAGLPVERKSAAYEFSRKCLNLTIILFKEIERLNKKHIVIGDILHSHPRTSLPISGTQQDYLDLTERVVNVLNGDLEFLS